MNGRQVRPDLARIVLWVPIEVRYGDFDVQGHVNNVRYFTYFEQARVEFFSQLRADPEAGTIVWPNEADIAPETLFAHAQRRARATA